MAVKRKHNTGRLVASLVIVLLAGIGALASAPWFLTRAAHGSVSSTMYFKDRVGNGAGAGAGPVDQSADRRAWQLHLDDLGMSNPGVAQWFGVSRN